MPPKRNQLTDEEKAKKNAELRVKRKEDTPEARDLRLRNIIYYY
jgi:hypothetical protein